MRGLPGICGTLALVGLQAGAQALLPSCSDTDGTVSCACAVSYATEEEAESGECAYQTFSGINVTCSGAFSCYRAAFDESIIQCQSTDACYGSRFFRQSEAVCTGVNSCAETHFKYDAMGTCNGTGACPSIILSDQTTTTCGGENACTAVSSAVTHTEREDNDYDVAASVARPWVWASS